MERPILNKINLKNVNLSSPGEFFITMSVGQWDLFLQEGYEVYGATLLELDDNEIPINAYKKVI